MLRTHLKAIIDPSTDIEVHGITPHDSYAQPLVEFRCAREVICNAVHAEREGHDAFVIGHFQDAGLYECRSAVDIDAPKGIVGILMITDRRSSLPLIQPWLSRSERTPWSRRREPPV